MQGPAATSFRRFLSDPAGARPDCHEVFRVDEVVRVEGIEEYYNTPPKPVYEDSDDTPEPMGFEQGSLPCRRFRDP